MEAGARERAVAGDGHRFPVGVVRALEFVADAPGDWAFHRHKTHHAMNAMGHEVKNFIGVPQHTLAKVVRSVAPDTMAMGSDGMAMMGEMEMPMPDNTLPMMTASGPFGPIEMGGMFTVIKVREGLAANDYRDPGWYSHPQGTVAYEVDASAAGEPPRQTGDSGSDMLAAMSQGHEHHH
jgi:manganese oxidase